MRPQVPKDDAKRLKQVAIHEKVDVADVFRAIIRSFVFEYREREKKGEPLPLGWLRHQLADTEKMVRVKAWFPTSEIAEFNRISSIEGERIGVILTAPAVARAVIRAFLVAQEKADAEKRPLVSADLFDLPPVTTKEKSRLTA